MSLAFSGERLTPDIFHPGLHDLIRLGREFGTTFPLGMLYLRAESLSRYQFVVRSVTVKNKKVLDIACGIGYGAELLKEEGPAQFVVGADIDYSSIEYGQKKYGRDSLTFAQADGEHLPFASGFFDVVVSLETIEHLRAPKVFLNEVCRILTPDGVFVASTPNREVTNPGASLEDKPSNPFHIREFSLEEFKELLGGYFPEVELFGQEANWLGMEKNPWIRRIKRLVNLSRMEEVTKVVPLGEDKNPLFIIAICNQEK